LNITNNSFGRITSARGGEFGSGRTGQVALRLEFLDWSDKRYIRGDGVLGVLQVLAALVAERIPDARGNQEQISGTQFHSRRGVPCFVSIGNEDAAAASEDPQRRGPPVILYGRGLHFGTDAVARRAHKGIAQQKSLAARNPFGRELPERPVFGVADQAA